MCPVFFTLLLTHLESNPVHRFGIHHACDYKQENACMCVHILYTCLCLSSINHLSFTSASLSSMHLSIIYQSLLMSIINLLIYHLCVVYHLLFIYLYLSSIYTYLFPIYHLSIFLCHLSIIYLYTSLYHVSFIYYLSIQLSSLSLSSAYETAVIPPWPAHSRGCFRAWKEAGWTILWGGVFQEVM